MSVTIAGIEFDNVDYDAGGDVLYLHVGDPSDAVYMDESPEGHAVRTDAAGQVIGLTIVRPKHLLEEEGEVRVTFATSNKVAHDQLAALLA